MTIKKSLFVDIISALLILLFIYTALTKIIDHKIFRLTLAQSPLIGSISNLLSWAIPLMELIAALFLFFPAGRKCGLLSSFLLMLVFTVYIFYMVFFSSKLPCSCGGIINNMTWIHHLIFNIFFTAIAGVGVGLKMKNNFLLQ